MIAGTGIFPLIAVPSWQVLCCTSSFHTSLEQRGGAGKIVRGSRRFVDPLLPEELPSILEDSSEFRRFTASHNEALQDDTYLLCSRHALPSHRVLSASVFQLFTSALSACRSVRPKPGPLQSQSSMPRTSLGVQGTGTETFGSPRYHDGPVHSSVRNSVEWRLENEAANPFAPDCSRPIRS